MFTGSLWFEEGLEFCFFLLNTDIKSFQLIFLLLNVVPCKKKREKNSDKTSYSCRDNDLNIKNCTAKIFLSLSTTVVKKMAHAHVIRGCNRINTHKVVKCSLHGWPRLWHFSGMSVCLCNPTGNFYYDLPYLISCRNSAMMVLRPDSILGAAWAGQVRESQ